MDISLLTSDEQWLRYLLAIALLVGVVYPFLVRRAVQKGGDRSMWVPSAIVIVAAPVLFAIGVKALTGVPSASLATDMLTALPVFGLPVLAAALVSHRLSKHWPSVSSKRMWMVAVLGYVAALPVGIFLSSRV